MPDFRSAAWISALTVLLLCALLAACGGGGVTPHNHPPGTPSAGGADITPPVIVNVTGAGDGAALIRTITLSASAVDETQVAGMQLALDGTPLATVSAASLAYQLDTARYTPGPHKLLFTAHDAAGNTGRMELRVTFLAAAQPTSGAPLPGVPVVSDNPSSPDSGQPGPGPATPSAAPLTSGEPDEYGLPALDLSSPPDPSDTTPPDGILVASPSQGAPVWDEALLIVVIRDNKGIWYMDAWFNGKQIGSVSNNFGLTTTFDTNVVPDGRHDVLIRVVDVGGNVGYAKAPVDVENNIDHGRPRYLGGFPFDQPGLRGDVLLAPQVYEDRALESTTLKIDGVEVYNSDSQAPEYLWRTGDYSEAIHQLIFTFTDTVKNKLTLYAYAEVDRGGPRYSVSGRLLAPNGKDADVRRQVFISRLAEGNWEPTYFSYSDLDDRRWNVETDGTGSFIISGVTPGPHKLLAGYKPNYRLEASLDLHGDYALPSALAKYDVAAPYAPRIAVVTGDGEALPDWLAKCGWGEVDSSGRLRPGTEKFLLVDGNDSLPPAYLDFPQFLNNPVMLGAVTHLFIAAGTHYEDQFIASPGLIDRLRDWRVSGPKSTYRWLYCGGSSYDYLEQINPGLFNFGTGLPDTDSEVPEPHNAAEGRPAPGATLRFDTPQSYNPSSSDMMHWLAAAGHPGHAYRADFGFTLPAGWVGAESRYQENWDSQLSCEPMDAGSWQRTMLMSRYGNALFNGLPIPAQPSPQWTLQERIVQYRLLGGWD